MKYDILDKIQSAVWAIHPASVHALLQVCEQIQAGALKEPKEEMPKISASVVSRDAKPRDTANSQGVAVYDVSGIISKQSWYWTSIMGLMDEMRLMEQDPSVVGHFLRIDCTGGEATNLLEFATMIRSELQKPVVARIDGYACSGGYWVAAAADEVYCASETNISGSIGVMKSWRDWKGYYEANGIKYHEVYATQSSEKNQPMIQANAGDYELLKQSEIDPFAQYFIDHIKALRPATNGNEDVFTGKTFMAQEAQDKGLIDGIMTFQQAINRVFELSNTAAQVLPTTTNYFSNTQNQKSKMDFAFLEKLGISAGQNALTDDQMAKINAALEASDANKAENGELKMLVTKIGGKLDAQMKGFEALEKRLDAYEAAPAATVATPNVPPIAEVEEPLSIIAQTNRAISEAMYGK